MGQEGKRGA